MDTPRKKPNVKLLIPILFGLLVGLVFVTEPRSITPGSASLSPLISSVASQFKQEKISSELPVRIKIPTINVDAAIEHVGLTSEGNMDAPKGPAETAWFKQGPRPGESGNAVISGHFGWKDGIPAVFDNLSKLKKGDKLFVKDQRGVTTIFVVRDIKTYDPNANTTEIFQSYDGAAHLNLITCGGTWDKNSNSYSKRLVIFTDQEVSKVI